MSPGVLQMSLEMLGGSQGSLVGARDVLMKLPGGSFGGPWGSWSCSCEPLGGCPGILSESQGSLGGPWGVLGRPCGRPSAPDVTHTDVSAFRMFSCLSVYVFYICFVLVLAMAARAQIRQRCHGLWALTRKRYH